MVLQRDADIPVWGWADPGESVIVELGGNTASTTADDSGDWKLELPAMEAGGPYTVTVSGNNEINVNNVLLGDVWVCSGQSNMETTMERVSPIYLDEIANANYPDIRYIKTPTSNYYKGPLEDLTGGEWLSCSPETIWKYCAVPYFFGKHLHLEKGIPIGLINSSVGGSAAEAWLSEDAAQRFPEKLAEGLKWRDDSLVESTHAENKRINDESNTYHAANDLGTQANPNWSDPSTDTSDWKPFQIPNYWRDTDLKGMAGIVWFRKEFDVPTELAGKPAKLLLGTIVDADTAYLNGQQVGRTYYRYPPRRYSVPENLLKAGTNTLVLKVQSYGNGEFTPDKPFDLHIEDQTIDLRGDWTYKLGVKSPPPSGKSVGFRGIPMSYYNPMIAPLHNARIKGFIWYQGETNAGRPDNYDQIMDAMITDWRAKWGQGNLPFIITQLANFMEAKDEPSDSGWALMRERQRESLRIPNTGLAVIIDIGEWNDIHPLNKEDVGNRLALAARKLAYGEKDLVSSGPLYKSAEFKKGKAYITFTDVGSGLHISKGDKLEEFAIAGEDGIFVWAETKIKGDCVIAWNDDVPNPTTVRYAWASNPAKANLYNKEGLPASPFSTAD